MMSGTENMENIVVVGFGWVGQANALALRRMGYPVFYYDIVPPVLRYAKDNAGLYGEISPLQNILERDSQNTWYIVSIGDRVKEDGTQDITLIKKALESLKPARSRVILRSTVLPQNLKALDFDFYVPEFLHERHAVEECLNPHYFVLGRKDASLAEPSFLSAWQLHARKVFKGTPEQASYIKYLSNLWNATRVAFINEFGDLTRDEAVIDFVFEKKNYLRYGQAFGGHCLPKDLFAFWSAHATNKYNSMPPVQATRKKLRFLVNAVARVIPERSLGDVKEIWNDLARKNARYFTNTKTPSGRDVNEFELRKTGLVDYEKYISGDAMLAPLLQNQSSVLEIGCGLGRMTEFFPRHFAKTAAIDISDVMVESAKKRLVGIKNIDLKISDGKNIAFSDNHFNLVFSYQTLQHVPAHEILAEKFKEIYRTLKPGGIAKLHLRAGRSPYKWHWAYGVSLTPAEAKQLAESAGFKFIKHEIEDSKSLWIWLEK